MKYVTISPQQWSQTKKMKLRKDMIGGLLKQGTIVYAFHGIKIFVPDPGHEAEPPELRVADVPIDKQLYDSFLEPVEVRK